MALLEGEASAAASQARQAQDQLADHQRETAALQEVLQAEREAHRAEIGQLQAEREAHRAETGQLQAERNAHRAKIGQLQQWLQDAVELQEQQREAHSTAVAELRGRHADELQAHADRLTSQHQSLSDRHSAQLRKAHAQELEGAQAAGTRLEQLLGAERQKSLNLKVGGQAWAAASGGRESIVALSAVSTQQL